MKLLTLYITGGPIERFTIGEVSDYLAVSRSDFFRFETLEADTKEVGLFLGEVNPAVVAVDICQNDGISVALEGLGHRQSR